MPALVSATVRDSNRVRTINLSRITVADFTPRDDTKGVPRATLWINFSEDDTVVIQGEDAERVHTAILQASRFLDLEDTA